MSFTERTKAPFRLDVVGSFLRPDAIKEARAAYAEMCIRDSKQHHNDIP